MLLSSEDPSSKPHPYWYAQVLGIFHARVIFNDPESEVYTGESVLMEFLWIRWYGMDNTRRFGWKVKSLPRVGFIDPARDKSMDFGFLDPALVVRAVHLIPDETSGRFGPSSR